MPNAALTGKTDDARAHAHSRCSIAAGRIKSKTLNSTDHDDFAEGDGLATHVRSRAVIGVEVQHPPVRLHIDAGVFERFIAAEVHLQRDTTEFPPVPTFEVGECLAVQRIKDLAQSHSAGV